MIRDAVRLKPLALHPEPRCELVKLLVAVGEQVTRPARKNPARTRVNSQLVDPDCHLTMISRWDKMYTCHIR